MKITNTSKAPQGVHTAKGVRFVKPGATVDLDLTPEGHKLAKRLKFLDLHGAAPDAKAKAEAEPAFTTRHKGGGRYVVVDASGGEVEGVAMTKAEAEQFNALSDEDKAAFLAPKD